MNKKKFQDRIEFNPKILSGKAVIKDTRISVELILELLANEWSYKDILENYPHLIMDDIFACIDYARIRIKEEIVHPVKA